MKIVRRIPFWIVLSVSVIIFILPFLFMVSNTFEEFSYVLPTPPRILPSRISFDAYRHVLTQSVLPQAALNSVLITLCTAFFTVLVSSLSAYGFARIDFLGRELLFRIYLATLMLPGFLSIIPQFLVLQAIGPGDSGLIGQKAGLILLYVGTGICGNTFFLRDIWPPSRRSWRKPYSWTAAGILPRSSGSCCPWRFPLSVPWRFSASRAPGRSSFPQR